jgi:hypothetical protein
MIYMKIRFVKEYEIEEEDELEAMIKAEKILVKDMAEAVRLALDPPTEDTNYLVELFDIESNANGE